MFELILTNHVNKKQLFHILLFLLFVLVVIITPNVFASNSKRLTTNDAYYNQTTHIKKTYLSLWDKFKNDYPDNILLNNFKNDTNQQYVNIFEIRSGDSDNILNPTYIFPEKPVISLKIGNIFSISVNYIHVEGIKSEIKVINDTIKQIPVHYLDRISYNDTMGYNPGIKTYYFLPYDIHTQLHPGDHIQSKNIIAENTVPRSGNLTIIFAPDSETSVYYKTKVNITDGSVKSSKKL